MQYARRPVQLAHLKNSDIKNNVSSATGSNEFNIHFPGTKDLTSITGFRDSKFEMHPLGEHISNLFLIHFKNIKKMYEHILGITLTEIQFNQLPCFCTRKHFERALQKLGHNFRDGFNIDFENELIHLPAAKISKIIRWENNLVSPECLDDKVAFAKVPLPPISHRTLKILVITATRLRHTRARQLARLGMTKHVLSHWLGHSTHMSLRAYYNDPAEEARKINDAMTEMLTPLAMMFTGKLIDSASDFESQSTSFSHLEFSQDGQLKSVGLCGKHSFCATTSVPVPCYRCKNFQPLITAPHQEVLEALLQRQIAEEQSLKIGGQRNLLIPLDLSADIRAVQQCIDCCNARKVKLGIQ